MDQGELPLEEVDVVLPELRQEHVEPQECITVRDVELVEEEEVRDVPRRRVGGVRTPGGKTGNPI